MTFMISDDQTTSRALFNEYPIKADNFEEAIEEAWGYFDDMTDKEKDCTDGFTVYDDDNSFDILAVWKNRIAIENLALDMQEADVWDEDDCEKLCRLAGLEKEWKEADGETFEAVVNRAARRLNVDIF